MTRSAVIPPLPFSWGQSTGTSDTPLSKKLSLGRSYKMQHDLHPGCAKDQYSTGDQSKCATGVIDSLVISLAFSFHASFIEAALRTAVRSVHCSQLFLQLTCLQHATFSNQCAVSEFCTHVLSQQLVHEGAASMVALTLNRPSRRFACMRLARGDTRGTVPCRPLFPRR